MSKTLLKELTTQSLDNLPKEVITEVKAMTLLQASGNGFVNDLDHNIAEDVLSNITCPSLILHSEYDNAVPLEMAQHAKAQIKNVVLKTYTNRWGHLLWVGNESIQPIRDLLEFIDNK